MPTTQTVSTQAADSKLDTSPGNRRVAERLATAILSFLYAVYFFFAAATYWPICAVLRLISLWNDKDLRRLNKWTAAYTYRTLMLSPGWRFRYEGLENLEHGGPFVMVANHQSYADIVVLSALRHQFRWVSKNMIFYVPFLGWIMRLNGHVGIDRGDIGSTRRMIRTSAALLQRGISVLIFPEGTRSPDGRVHEFREGPFRVAKHTGRMILPIAIFGSREILPKGSLQMKFDVDVIVRILPPIDVGGLSPAQSTDKLHDLIQDEVEKMRLEHLYKVKSSTDVG